MKTLRKGDKCEEVKVLQSALNRAGYNLAVDGSYGGKTRNAVIDFQGNHDLDPDGVCGPKTWKALEPYLDLTVISLINQCVEDILNLPSFNLFMEMVKNEQ